LGACQPGRASPALTAQPAGAEEGTSTENGPLNKTPPTFSQEQEDEEDEDEDEDEEEEVKPKKSAKKASPAKKGKKAAPVVVEESSDDEPMEEASKREEEDEDEDEEVVVTPKKSAKKAAPAKKGKKVAPVVVEESSDDEPKEEASKREEDDEDEDEEVVVTPKKSAKKAAPAKKGKKAAPVVVEESSDDEPDEEESKKEGEASEEEEEEEEADEEEETLVSVGTVKVFSSHSDLTSTVYSRVMVPGDDTAHSQSAQASHPQGCHPQGRDAQGSLLPKTLTIHVRWAEASCVVVHLNLFSSVQLDVSQAATPKAATPKAGTAAPSSVEAVLAAAKALRKGTQAVMLQRVQAATDDALAARAVAAQQARRQTKQLRRKEPLKEPTHPFKVVPLDRLQHQHHAEPATRATLFQRDRLLAQHSRSDAMLLPTTVKGPPFGFGRQ
jgi:hypothetical protein